MRSWVNKFKAFYTTSCLDRCTIAEQQAYLRICIDTNLEARIQDKIQENTPIFGEDGCIQLLEEEFLLKYPLFTRRLEFFRYNQTEGQLFTDYCAKLKAIGEEADLHKLEVDDLYVFRYICGTSDNKLKEKFLKQEDPTLDDLNRIARAYEISSSALQAMKDTSTVAQVQNERNLKGKRNFKEKRKGKTVAEKFNNKIGNCHGCGGNHTRDVCPIKHLTCHKCGKIAHLARVCRGKASRPNSRLPSRSSSPQQSKSNMIYVNSVNLHGTFSRNTPRVSISIASNSGTPFQFAALPDSGATRTIIAEDLVKKHGIPIRQSPNERLFAANNEEMACEGRATLFVTFKGIQVTTNALVSSSIKNDILICWYDLQALGILQLIFQILQELLVKPLLQMLSVYAGELLLKGNDRLLRHPTIPGIRLLEKLHRRNVLATIAEVE
jgi:hypothetical protein